MISKKIKVFLKIVISLSILIVLINKINFHEIFGIERFDGIFLILAICFLPLRLLVKSLRWQTIMLKAIPGMDYLKSLKIMLVSIALGLVTPMRLGQAGIITYVKSDSSVKTGFYAYFDVIMDLIVVIFAGCASLLMLYLSPVEFFTDSPGLLNTSKHFGLDLLYLPKYVYITGAAGLFLIGLLVIFLFEKPSVFYGFYTKGSNAGLSKFLSRFDDFKLYSRGELIRIILYSVVIFIINLTQFLFLTYAFFRVSIPVVFISYSITLLAVCLPITIAGLGARESVAAWVFSSFGINPAIGIKASFLLFILNMVIPAIIGLVIYNLKGYGREVKAV